MVDDVNILAHYEAAADEKLAKLARRGARYGQAIAWRKEPFVEIRKRKRWDGRDFEIEIPMIAYHVEGEAPRVGEYKFVAELERVPGAGVIIAGGEVGALGREWNGECQHCGKNRARKLGYVVEGADGGRVIVGRACLRDYVGRDVPAAALWIFQFERELAGAADEEGGWGCARWEDEVLGVVAAARAAIALYGWAPKSFDGMNTAEAVGCALNPGVLKGEREKARREIRAELKARGDHYEAVAREVIEGGRALEPRGDYEHNLKVALAGQYCDGKRFGLVVSAAAAFDRKKARDADRVAELAKRAEAAKVSKWFGAVGDKAEAELQLVSKRAMPDNGFGPSSLYVFAGPAGELIKWFSGVRLNVAGRPAEAGAKFKARFTVKKQGEYQGMKETVVLRLKEIA